MNARDFDSSTGRNGYVLKQEPTFEELNAAQLNGTPLVQPGAELEPALLLDASGSNDWPASDDGRSVKRWEVAKGIVYALVDDLAEKDSQAAHEDEGGGVMVTIFSDADRAKVVGDINRKNRDRVWGSIQYGGSTYGAPGVQLVINNYMEEFGDRPKMDRPLLGLCVTTDGEMYDLDDFVTALNTELAGIAKVVIAVYGYGEDHRKAVTAYRQVETAHPKNVRVLEIPPNTNPKTVSGAMLALLGLN